MNSLIAVDEQFLYDILGSLESMIDYADDGMIAKDDPDYSAFNNSVELARVIASGLAKLLDDNK